MRYLLICVSLFGLRAMAEGNNIDQALTLSSNTASAGSFLPPPSSSNGPSSGTDASATPASQQDAAAINGQSAGSATPDGATGAAKLENNAVSADPIVQFMNACIQACQQTLGPLAGHLGQCYAQCPSAYVNGSTSEGGSDISMLLLLLFMGGENVKASDSSALMSAESAP